ncbi:Bug family tripartite tricarboxylate transporter substrate binding protein [Candidimonas nitroreducens]|uniref:MFS transporter n=1 Tax=Candidimonas nitroreducens TaxID=683354 RepID=A0A225M847_9BURK|nr:tripartite tricarboxylate transporter substrate binding protein [Candidimonas nitroreducens]OWT56902.1 MFS transporter [Candidimonas nitroreducens]
MEPEKWARRYWLATAASLLLAASAPVPALSAAYPSRPITLIVPFAAGSSTDSVVRPLAKKLAHLLHVQIIVLNRPGGNFAVASNVLKASPADGYTLLVATGSMLVQNYVLGKNVGYDPLRDFSFIGTIGIHPGILVARNNLPANDAHSLFAYARAHPGQLNFASGGVGSASHVMMEYVLSALHTDMVHVPMSGDNQAMLELAAGRVDVALTAAQVALPLVKAGRVKAMAVTTPERLAYLPNVPTFSQAGLLGVESVHPYGLAGLVGPAGMPLVDVQIIGKALRQIISSSEESITLRDRFHMEPYAKTSEEFRHLIQIQIRNWAEIAERMRASPRS